MAEAQERGWGVLAAASAAPLIIWSVHFLTVYVLTALVCEDRLEADILFWVTAVTIAAATLLAGQGALHALRLRGSEGMARILHFAGGLSVLVSLVALMLVAYPAFVLSGVYCV